MLGKAAIIKELKAIKTTDITIDFLRPTLSAKEPKSQEPIGCIKNPAAKTPKALICWITGLSEVEKV